MKMPSTRPNLAFKVRFNSCPDSRQWVTIMGPRISRSPEPLPRKSCQMLAVAIWNVSETTEHGHLWSLQGAQKLLTPPPPKTQSNPQIVVVERQGLKSIESDQIGFPMSEPSPAWIGEIRAPNRDEALSSLVPGNGGGLRVGVVTGLLIAALGLGWAGLANPYRFFKSDPASTPVQQPPVSDRAAPAIDQETASGAPNSNQASTPRGSDLSSYKVGGESIHRADQVVVSPQEAVPSTARKTTATELSAAVPLPREKKAQRLTPTPDTRPNTIEGWRVRHVSGGTIVLQGPDGIHKASVGDTVPGAGRIDSVVRWGNRLVVATSRGLITTD